MNMLFKRDMLMLAFSGFEDERVSPYLTFRLKIALVGLGLITSSFFPKDYPKNGTVLQTNQHVFEGSESTQSHVPEATNPPPFPYLSPSTTARS